MAKTIDNYLIKIFLVDVIEFESYNPSSHILKRANLHPNDAIRTAVVIKYGDDKSCVFDYETGEELHTLEKDRIGRVQGPVYAGTKYITKFHPYPGLSDDMFNECIDMYNDIQELDKKKEEGKIIEFPRRKLV